MSRLKLKNEIPGATSQTIQRVDSLVDILGNDDFSNLISNDMLKFIRKVGNIHKFSLRRYVVVYLDYLAKKYGVPISKNYLCNIYEVSSKGWMKRLGDLKKAGLIEEINVQKNFVGPALKIIEEMKEAKLIGLIQYQLAVRSMNNLFEDYPLIKGSNPHILIAFACIYTTNKMSINDIARLFYNLELKSKREIINKDKVWYYQTFRRITSRAGLVPLT